MYNTIIFDLDGTLLNTIDDLASAVNFVQKKFGWDVHAVDLVRKNVGNGIKKLVERSIPYGMENSQFEEAFKAFKEFYQENCQIKTAPYEGVMELLKNLKETGYKMAIVSNKAQGAVSELNDIYFSEFIDVAIGENEDGGIKKKPAPDEVEMALLQLNSKKEESLYVGDSEVDKATADNSGLDCVLCQWGFRDRELLQSLNPKAIIATPGELIDVCNNL